MEEAHKPDSPPPPANLSECSKTPDPGNGEAEFQAAIRLAENMSRPEDMEEVETLLESALSRQPSDPWGARGHLGWLYYSTGRILEAADCYLQFLDDHPDNAEAHYLGGRCLSRCRHHSEAQKLLRRAGRMDFPGLHGWKAYAFLSFRYNPILEWCWWTYRTLVWVLSWVILTLSTTIQIRFRFTTAAFLKWCLRNGSDGLKLLSYTRAAELEFAFTRLDPPPRALVIDIGAGNSPFVPFAASQGLRLIGSDPDRYIQELREGYADVRSGRLDDRLLLIQCDGSSLPFRDGSVPYVVSISTVEHIPDDGDIDLMTEIGRVLSPGGRAVVTTEGSNRSTDFWLNQPFHTGMQYGNSEIPPTDNFSIGFYRFYDEQDLRTRLGNVSKLFLVESGFLIDRSGMRRYFPDAPETNWLRLISPWKALLGRLSMKAVKFPLPKRTDLEGSVGYVILEKPSEL